MIRRLHTQLAQTLDLKGLPTGVIETKVIELRTGKDAKNMVSDVPFLAFWKHSPERLLEEDGGHEVMDLVGQVALTEEQSKGILRALRKLEDEPTVNPLA